MNADRFLALYDRVADAPDAVARLRRFVLELAVRGKLVEQDPSDEPASKLRDLSAPTGISNGDVPEGWHRVVVGAVLEFRYGKALKAADRLDAGPVPVYGSNGIVGFTTQPLTVRPSVIVGRKGSAGALNKCDGPSWTTDVAYYVEAPEYLDLSFLYLSLDTLRLSGLAKGVKLGLSRADVYGKRIHVPPLAEHHRIVAKADELMALCDRLEETRTAREDSRDRLTKASLARLTAPETDAGAFRDHARFAIQALPALTARADQVKQLRQTILSLAGRGKLVEQDSTDEPASELLKRIAEVKGKLGVKHEVQPVGTNEAPFRLPSGWRWSRIGELCTKTGSGSTPRGGKSVYKTNGVPFLRSQNVYDDGLRLANVAYIGGDVHARMAGTAVRAGDLLLNITGGSMGRCCRVPDGFAEANVSQHVAIIRAAVPEMADYVHKLVLSPYFQAFIFRGQTGAGRGGLPKNRMDRIVVALPPLAEQHRIVGTVEALMVLCDQLEAGLDATDGTRHRLLESLLQDTLAPFAYEAATPGAVGA